MPSFVHVRIREWLEAPPTAGALGVIEEQLRAAAHRLRERVLGVAQLEMYRPTLDGLPAVMVPPGYELRTYRPGDEHAWVAILKACVCADWTVDRVRSEVLSRPQFEPSGLFFAVDGGALVGSACVWRRKQSEHRRGMVHLIAVLPEHRGKGLGYQLTLSLLHWLRSRGFTDATLYTDDFRLPALRQYVRLRFEPLVRGSASREKWREISRKLSTEERQT
ncbi:MAG: GNAT family N-acetyltransferase [Gemmatimonadota bacterium]